ncbi:MAG: M15 family metallopeptidase [Cyanobacteria bacterium P01_A01_bin.135]
MAVFAAGAAALAILGGAGAAILLDGVPVVSSTKSVSYAEAGLQQALQQAGVVIPTNTLLGHKPYSEAPTDTLVAITADGGITLRRPAAEAFTSMAQDAQREDIYLLPLSGFRSVEQQQYLFFGIKEEQAQIARERATVSAPPGYSEHHTGYAIDIGDADRPETHLEQSFENTKAFRWLSENAARYSYELSFDKGESGPVSYEPWQWRYVGDRHSLETFYSDR